MNSLFLYFVLFFMVATAILCVITDKLFTAVVYSGTLSVFTTLCYLLLGAPDVALAEAVIGATVASAIFLITLKKYRVFNVYLVGNKSNQRFMKMTKTIVKTLKKHDIQPNILITDSDESVFKLFSLQNSDLVAIERGDVIELHGEVHSQYFSAISSALDSEINSGEVIIIDSIYDSIVSYREGSHE